MARPKKSEADLAVAVTISASADALLEDYVETQIPPGGPVERTPHLSKSYKRSILDGLIVRELGIDGKYPMFVDLSAPIETIDANERIAAEDWLVEEKLRLNREAPRAIKRALETNIRARKIERAIESGDQEALDRARAEKVTLLPDDTQD